MQLLSDHNHDFLKVKRLCQENAWLRDELATTQQKLQASEQVRTEEEHLYRNLLIETVKTKLCFSSTFMDRDLFLLAVHAKKLYRVLQNADSHVYYISYPTALLLNVEQVLVKQALATVVSKKHTISHEVPVLNVTPRNS